MAGLAVPIYWTIAISLIMLLAIWIVPFKTKAPKSELFKPIKERRRELKERDKELKNKKLKFWHYILVILLIIMSLSDFISY